MIDLTHLKAGDIIQYSGIIYTARDAAHIRLKEIIDSSQTLPVDFSNSFLYYAGPTPTKPGCIVGSIGPTTSSRMDAFIDYMPKLKINGMIGKGPRLQKVIDSCKNHKMVYFIATGGAGALLSKHVISCEEVAFGDLGCESIKKLEVHEFPLIVAYDIYGNNIYERDE